MIDKTEVNFHASLFAPLGRMPEPHHFSLKTERGGGGKRNSASLADIRKYLFKFIQHWDNVRPADTKFKVLKLKVCFSVIRNLGQPVFIFKMKKKGKKKPRLKFGGMIHASFPFLCDPIKSCVTHKSLSWQQFLSLYVRVSLFFSMLSKKKRKKKW